MIAFLADIFCHIDDFCNNFYNKPHYFLASNSNAKRKKPCSISVSEIMTIVILFHMSGYRNFKDFYLLCVLKDLKPYFPKAVSYSRFVQLMEHALMPLSVFFSGLKGRETGIYYVDSTTIEVCHIKREKRHKVFKGLAAKAKSSMGWFFGFKLHLIINDKGEILDFMFTQANVDDREPLKCNNFHKRIFGKLFGDKGYIGKDLFEQLFIDGVHLVTKIKKNMKNSMMLLQDKIMLRKRSLIETVYDQLKNICQIEHTRHRSFDNFITNLLSGLIAYSFFPKKPSINVDFENNRLVA